MDIYTEAKEAARKIRECQSILTAIGDENRQHLQILKNAGLIQVRKEGTKNYYYFDSDMKSLKKLIAALQNAIDVALKLPSREE